MAPSSEFLTLYRALPRYSLRLNSPARLPATTTVSRSFVSTPWRSDNQHATNKSDKLDVQSDNASKGKQARTTGTGGTATDRSDSSGNTAKAKKDHPEAPDVVIGMQDERGSKGS